MYKLSGGKKRSSPRQTIRETAAVGCVIKPSTMVNSCCMVGCTNKQNKEKGISLHMIPQYPPWRREALTKAINRLDPDAAKPTQWVPTQNPRVCSVHFLEGKSVSYHYCYREFYAEESMCYGLL